MRTRLRPAYGPEETRAIYDAAVGRPLWHGHELRIERTIQIAKEMWSGTGFVADLSCGDGRIPLGIGVPDELLLLDDLTHPDGMWIEDAIDTIPPVELFICSETLEHIDDPDALLVKIRENTEKLLLSTPCDEQPGPDGYNPEHYWAWSTSDIADMLMDAGFATNFFELLVVDGFTFQIWRAR